MGVYPSYGVIFPEIKEHGYKNIGYSRSRNTITSTHTFPKVIWRSKTYHRKMSSCIATMDISKSVDLCAKFQISSFTHSYLRRKLFEWLIGLVLVQLVYTNLIEDAPVTFCIVSFFDMLNYFKYYSSSNYICLFYYFMCVRRVCSWGDMSCHYINQTAPFALFISLFELDMFCVCSEDGMLYVWI